MSTDFRALCAERPAVAELPSYEELRALWSWAAGQDQGPWPTQYHCFALAVLACWGRPTPPAVVERPSDEELLRAAAHAIEPYDTIKPGEYEAECNSAVHVYGSELCAFARDVLARWGQPPAPPAEGEIAELARWLRLRNPIDMEGEPDDCTYFKLTRAAELLERHAAPVPVPVAEPPAAPVPTFRDAIQLAQGCHDYSGGYGGTPCAEAFHAGIGTVVNVLTKAASGPWDHQTQAVFAVGAYLPLPAPAEGEVAELVTLLAVGADCSGGAKLSPDQCHRAANLLERLSPVPVPVSDRLPGPEDCDTEGRVWL